MKRIRYVPFEQMAATQADCLKQAGWNVREVPSEGIEWVDSVPASQETAAELASYTCTLQYPLDPVTGLPPNKDQLGLTYDYLTTWWLPCVEAFLGYHIETDVPTRESYIASKGAWDPYTDVQIAETSNPELYETCPRYAPANLLYGEGM